MRNATFKQTDPVFGWYLVNSGIRDFFPSPDLYHESLWAAWLSKIEAGEDQDEIDLSNRQKELEGYVNNPSENGIDIGEILNDEYANYHNVSNNIYAALVVSIWSKCEQTLNDISKLCADLTNCKPAEGYQFDKQKKFFKQELGIGLSTIPGYTELKALRILNNVYKHNDGFCTTESYNAITLLITNKWKIQENAKVNYTILPIRDILAQCHNFFEQLCSDCEKFVHSKTTIGNKNSSTP